MFIERNDPKAKKGKGAQSLKISEFIPIDLSSLEARRVEDFQQPGAKKDPKKDADFVEKFDASNPYAISIQKSAPNKP